MATAKDISPHHTGEQIAAILSKPAFELNCAELRFLKQALDRSGNNRWDVSLGEIFEYAAASERIIPVDVRDRLITDSQ